MSGEDQVRCIFTLMTKQNNTGKFMGINLRVTESFRIYYLFIILVVGDDWGFGLFESHLHP